MTVYFGPNPTALSGSILSESGLFGKRFVDYYADNFSFFDTAVLHGDTNKTTSIDNFTSSSDYYSWMWVGYFIPDVSGTWTFFTSSDDSSLLWIGDPAISGYPAISGFSAANAVVNNAGLHGDQERSGTITLDAGVQYPIRITFGENSGGDIMTVSFTPPGGVKTTNGLGYYFGGEIAWGQFVDR